MKAKLKIIFLILLNLNCFNFSLSPPSDSSDKTFNTCLLLTQLKKSVKGDYQLAKLARFGDKLFVTSSRIIPNQSGTGTDTSSGYLISSDGGVSWNSFPLPPVDPFSSSYKLYFTSDSVYNLRFRNLDKLSAIDLTQWITLPYSLSNNSDTIKFLDTYDSSILLATDTAVYRYDINIQSLVKVFNFTVAGSISSIDFSDSINGWIISNGKIYNSTDGGQAWNFKYTFAANTGYSTAFALSNSNFYFISANSLIYTVDNGATWLNYAFIDTQALNQLFFYSKTLGFVMQGGSLYRTIDQGNSWIKLFPNSTFTEKLTGHIWLTDKLGYAIGARSIYETVDSGATWKLKNSDVDYFTYLTRATPPMLCEF